MIVVHRFIGQFVCCFFGFDSLVAQEFHEMMQNVLDKMAERVVLPEPERESRGRLLQQRLVDSYRTRPQTAGLDEAP